MSGRIRRAIFAILMALLWTIFVVVGMHILVSLVIHLRAAAHHHSFADEADNVLFDPLALGLVQATMFGVAFAMHAFREEHRGLRLRETFHLNPISPRLLAACVVTGISLQFVLSEVENLTRLIVPTPAEMILREARMLEPGGVLRSLSMVFSFVLVAPVTEELLYRAMLLPELATRIQPKLAVIVVAVLFGVSHFGALSSVVYATIGGIVLGYVASRTKSTFASIAVHAAVNATPLLLPAGLVRIVGFNTYSVRVEHVPLALLLPAVLVVAGGLSAIFHFSGEQE